MIKIDTRNSETVEFQIGLSGVRNPAQIIFRLIMEISDNFNIAFKGVYTDGELAFTIPALKDFVPVLDNKQIPFHIEMVVDDYFQIIYESEIELLTPPEATVEKITHVKQEPIKEEKQKPIKIDTIIEVKQPSKFASGFSAFIKEREI